MSQQSPSSSAAGPLNYRDTFNPPRGEGPRYEFSRINYRMGCRVDQEPIDHVEEELALNPHQLRCTSCNIVKTPEWRKGPLGPRTLCNACGLIWGKLSRSKAALAAKNKQESSTKVEESEKSAKDPQTTTTTVGVGETSKRPAIDLITLTDIARKKRGRGRSTTRDDGEDVGSVPRLDENEVLSSAGQDESSSHLPHSNNGQPSSQSQAEDVIMSGDDSPPSSQPSFQPPAVEPDTIQESGCQIDSLLPAAVPVPPPQSPDTLPFSVHENHDKEGPVAGRKLTLSYLLA
ncbi:hypothetical protein BGZ47_007139 [Haplosporangium gracile]|nr:hypothetical protein BGZ47_007139 [Haplosporangium gracile]